MQKRFQFFVVEALRSLRNNFATTVAATVTVVIVLFFLGVFLLIGSLAYSKVEQQRKEVRVRVYLKDRALADQPAIDAIGARLKGTPGVKRVAFVSRRQAYEIMRKRLPEIVATLDSSPFPAEWDAYLSNPDSAKSVAAAVKGMPGVDEADYGKSRTDRLLRNATIIEAVIGGLVLVLAISAVLLIANTIRLSIFARRREVEVMKLVGATNWFVRLPFMIEGLLCGILGAVLAISLLGAAYGFWLSDFLKLGENGDTRPVGFTLLAFLLLLAGAVLGGLGSALTMRRFLRV